MSHRFQILLDRYALIRRAIEAERQSPHPSVLRLVRLKRLQLLVYERIRAFVEARAVRRASAPRLSAYKPAFAYPRAISNLRAV